MKIYDSRGSILGNLWSIHENTLEAKIRFDKAHCDFNQMKSYRENREREIQQDDNDNSEANPLISKQYGAT